MNYSFPQEIGVTPCKHQTPVDAWQSASHSFKAEMSVRSDLDDYKDNIVQEI